MGRSDDLREDTGSLFGVIPSVVLLDAEITASGRLLYIILTWRAGEKGYCWHSNRTLGEYLNLSAKRVSELLSALERRGHIETEIIRDEETGEILRRNIYPIVKSSRAAPIPKNKDTPPETSGEGIPKNRDININTKNKSNIPPIVPPEGDGAPEEPKPKRARRSREWKETSDWKPDRFEAFWSAYPKGKNRQAAINAWDKLRPSDELIHTMAVALKKQMQSEEWQRGIGIPYASTWLNGHRWTDEERTPAPPPDTGPGQPLRGEGVTYLE